MPALSCGYGAGASTLGPDLNQDERDSVPDQSGATRDHNAADASGGNHCRNEVLRIVQSRCVMRCVTSAVRFNGRTLKIFFLRAFLFFGDLVQSQHGEYSEGHMAFWREGLVS